MGVVLGVSSRGIFGKPRPDRDPLIAPRNPIDNPISDADLVVRPDRVGSMGVGSRDRVSVWWCVRLYSGVTETARPQRELTELNASERLLLRGLVVVFAVVWTVAGGAWLAARLSGATVLANDLRNGVIIAIVGLFTNVFDPAAAWPEPIAGELPGPVLYWLCTLTASAVPITMVGLCHRLRPARVLGLERRERLGVDVEARLATVIDIAPLVVDGPTPGRFVLGTVHDRMVATEAPIAKPTTVQHRPKVPTYRPARGSVLLVGPSQCGKSTCVITGILEWNGPILASSVKTDLIDETFGWRATQGECRVFDPTGITGLEQASWSPLRGARTIDGAQAAARALVDSAPRSSVEGGDFWYQLAEIVLAGYLWVAATHGLAMRDVVRWIFTQDAPSDDGPGEVQPLLLLSLSSRDVLTAEQAATTSEMLEGVWRLEERMRSSIFGTAQAAVWPWTNPTVIGSSQGCDVTLEWLLSGNNTVYASAPLRAARRLAPAIGGLIGDLLEQVAERVANTGRPLDPPLLIVLDEIGNTPLRELPELVSTLAGLGVQIITVWQSVAQIRAAYRDQHGTIVANHRSKVFFSGISDPDTFEMAMRLVGDEQVVSRQTSPRSRCRRPRPPQSVGVHHHHLGDPRSRAAPAADRYGVADPRDDPAGPSADPFPSRGTGPVRPCPDATPGRPRTHTGPRSHPGRGLNRSRHITP